MALPNTIQDIEADMTAIAAEWSPFSAVHAEYKRLLAVMGNVDGDEIVTLVLTAAANLDVLDGIGPSENVDVSQTQEDVMERIVELANEYLHGKRDARSFRSALVSALSRIETDVDTHRLAMAIYSLSCHTRLE